LLSVKRVDEAAGLHLAHERVVEEPLRLGVLCLGNPGGEVFEDRFHRSGARKRHLERERYMQPKANRVDRALFERPAAKSTGENSCGVDIYEVVVSCGKVTLSATFPQIR
jgi:hypothetical protein